MRRAPILAALVVACLLTSCAAIAPADTPNVCGYTWHRATHPAELITIRVHADWRDWPSGCQKLRTWGCMVPRPLGPGRWMAEIWLRETPTDTGPCSTLRHELEHAMGRDHVEAVQFSANDYTRR